MYSAYLGPIRFTLYNMDFTLHKMDFTNHNMEFTFDKTTPVLQVQLFVFNVKCFPIVFIPLELIP